MSDRVEMTGSGHKTPADYNIPYFVHENDMNRLDQSHKRVEKWQYIIIVMIFSTLVASNIAWLVYENSFEDVTTTIMQETSSEGGGDAILHGDNAGATFYGESKADDNN